MYILIKTKDGKRSVYRWFYSYEKMVGYIVANFDVSSSVALDTLILPVEYAVHIYDSIQQVEWVIEDENPLSDCLNTWLAENRKEIETELSKDM